MSERRRNPRGQGERLREEIVAAAAKMMADPEAPPLTLRGVAREVGVAATSVYLHFDNVESLVVEVARRGFASLRETQEAAIESADSPCARLRAGMLAYCDWGLANPGWYQWMFSNPLRITATVWDQLPGAPAFEMLVSAIADCLGIPASDPEARLSAQLLWNLAHGTMTLRIARPFLPWPPLADVVDEAVTRLVEARARP